MREGLGASFGRWNVAFKDEVVLQDAIERIKTLYPIKGDQQRLLKELTEDLERRMPSAPQDVLGWPPQATDVPGVAHALRRQGRRLSYLATLDQNTKMILITRIIVV